MCIYIKYICNSRGGGLSFIFIFLSLLPPLSHILITCHNTGVVVATILPFSSWYSSCCCHIYVCTYVYITIHLSTLKLIAAKQHASTSSQTSCTTNSSAGGGPPTANWSSTTTTTGGWWPGAAGRRPRRLPCPGPGGRGPRTSGTPAGPGGRRAGELTFDWPAAVGTADYHRWGARRRQTLADYGGGGPRSTASRSGQQIHRRPAGLCPTRPFRRRRPWRWRHHRRRRPGEDDDDDDDDELIVGIRQEGNSRLAGQLRLCSPQSQYLKYRKLILRRCGGLVVLGSNLSPEPPQSPQCGVKGRQIAL